MLYGRDGEVQISFPDCGLHFRSHWFKPKFQLSIKQVRFALEGPVIIPSHSRVHHQDGIWKFRQAKRGHSHHTLSDSKFLHSITGDAALSFALPSQEISTWVGVAVAERAEQVQVLGLLDASRGCLLGDVELQAANP